MLIGFGTWCSYMALSRKSVGCPWNRGPQNWMFYSSCTATSSCVARRLLCGVAADRHSPALKCTALLLMSGEPWWTQIWLKIRFSALFCTQCLNLFDAIASPLYNCTSVWPPDWRRPGLDLSRGNIPESCVDMRGGVSFLVFLLPRALQRLSDYPPSQMLDGFCLPFLRSHFRPCLSTVRSILAKMSWVVLGIRLRCWPVEVDIYNIYIYNI